MFGNSFDSNPVIPKGPHMDSVKLRRGERSCGGNAAKISSELPKRAAVAAGRPPDARNCVLSVLPVFFLLPIFTLQVLSGCP